MEHNIWRSLLLTGVLCLPVAVAGQSQALPRQEAMKIAQVRQNYQKYSGRVRTPPLQRG